MDESNYWVTPLALLPGVGLLVMSTAARFGQLHEELHRREGRGGGPRSQHLFRRARLLRNALVALYSASALLAVGGLVGSLASLWMERAVVAVVGVSTLAVGAVAYASVSLIRESLMLMDVIEEHLEESNPLTANKTV